MEFKSDNRTNGSLSADPVWCCSSCAFYRYFRHNLARLSTGGLVECVKVEQIVKRCCMFCEMFSGWAQSEASPHQQRDLSLIFARTSAGLRLLRANIFIWSPESCGCDFAPSRAQQSGGNGDIIDIHSARLSADGGLRACPRGAELRRPQVCAGCLFPHVELISWNSQQTGEKPGKAVPGAHRRSETWNDSTCWYLFLGARNFFLELHRYLPFAYSVTLNFPFKNHQTTLNV